MKQTSGSLNQELATIMPQLEEMKRKRNERKSQFSEVLKQINSISLELAGSTEKNHNIMCIDDCDLSMKKLDDLRSQLLLLQKEKVFFSSSTFSCVCSHLDRLFNIEANCYLVKTV